MVMNATNGHSANAHVASRSEQVFPAHEIEPVLDAAFARLTNETMSEESIRLAFAAFFDSLDRIRESLDGERWQDFIALCRRHPLHQLLLRQEPYTRRAFLKPRGYAGDAAMLDFVYSGAADVPLSGLAKALFRFVAWDCTGAQAVRARKEWLARSVDEAAARKARPRVLSLACGHLREADEAASVQAGLVEYVAADQDPESLLEVERRLSSKGVTTADTSVRALLRGNSSFSGFDFVYAAGLYDYLSRDVARQLTTILFEATAPGGKLLVANFVPDHPGRAYMEAFMDWNLVYRTRDEVWSLADGLDGRTVEDARVFQLEPCVAYLEVTRRAL